MIGDDPSSQGNPVEGLLLTDLEKDEIKESDKRQGLLQKKVNERRGMKIDSQSDNRPSPEEAAYPAKDSQLVG